MNNLKLNGHVMHQQFNIQQLYVVPTLFLFVLYLSEINWLDFYNRDEKYLQRGTKWVFKYSSLSFVFKGLNFLSFIMNQTHNS